MDEILTDPYIVAKIRVDDALGDYSLGLADQDDVWTAIDAYVREYVHGCSPTAG
jgi:hypothetical protein